MAKSSRNVEKHPPPKNRQKFFNSAAINDKWLLACIALVAVVFRAIYFYQLKSASPAYSLLIHDSALFNELAHHVLKNGPILEHAFYISPLYIYFLATIYKIFGDTYNVVRLIQFVMGIGTALLTFALARKFFSRTASTIAGLFAAVYAPFVFFESNLIGTSVVTFFFILSFYLLVRAVMDKKGSIAAFFSGSLLALAISGRPNLILVVPIPFLYLYFRRSSGNHVKAIVLLVGLSIPIGLTVIHNYVAERVLLPLTTHGGINFYIGNHQGASGVWEAPEGISASVSAINLEESKRFAEQATGKTLTPSQVSSFWYNRAFAFILHHPLQWVELLAKKFFMFWTGYETPLNYDYYFHQRYSSLLRFPLFNLPFIISFAIAGILLFIKKWKQYWLLYGIVAVVCLSVILFFLADRYRMPVVPIFIIFAAAFLSGLSELFRRQKRNAYTWSAVVLLLLAGQFYYTNNRVRHSNFANDCYNLSLAHLINEDYKKAIYWGERAVAEDRSLESAHYNLGIAYLKEKEQEKAFSEFSIAVQLDSTDAGAHRNLGALLLLRQQYWRALPHLQKAVKFDPTNITGLMNLGLGYYYVRKYNKAIETWQRILELDPQNEQARRNIEAAEEALK